MRSGPLGSIVEDVQRIDARNQLGLLTPSLGMVTTLITGGAISFALLGVFLILRRRSKRFYAPRTYLGSIPERFVPIPNSLAYAHLTVEQRADARSPEWPLQLDRRLLEDTRFAGP